MSCPQILNSLYHGMFILPNGFSWFYLVGYVATPQSFTQPNLVDHPDDHCSTPSATSLYVHTLTRGSSNGNAVSLHSHNPISRLTDDGGASGDYSRVRFNTPPTKEFTHPLRPSSSHLSTSARRFANFFFISPLFLVLWVIY